MSPVPQPEAAVPPDAPAVPAALVAPIVGRPHFGVGELEPLSCLLEALRIESGANDIPVGFLPQPDAPMKVEAEIGLTSGNERINDVDRLICLAGLATLDTPIPGADVTGVDIRRFLRPKD